MDQFLKLIIFLMKNRFYGGCPSWVIQNFIFFSGNSLLPIYIQLLRPVEENFPKNEGPYRSAPREIPGPVRISKSVCTKLAWPGLPSLLCSHRSDSSDTSFLHTLFIHYTFFPKWRNYSFRRRLPFYVIFILWLRLTVASII